MLDNLKSIFILKKIFVKIKIKRKLNIIKYNKRLKVKLSINKGDFEIYIKLNEFNNKYKANIPDIDIQELNLSWKYLADNVLKDLAEIKLNDLNILDLTRNEISHINIFENLDFKELKILNLSRNEISDINILEKINFKELKELYLNGNYIADISI